MLTLGEGRLPTGAKLRFLKVAPTYRAWGFVVPIPSQFCPLVQEIQSLWGLVGSRNQLRELGGGGRGRELGQTREGLLPSYPDVCTGNSEPIQSHVSVFFQKQQKI